MVCTGCGRENGPGARFCSECGVRLVTSCPNCAAPVGGGDRFCSQCGAALTVPVPPPSEASRPRGETPGDLSLPLTEGENRVATVLFTDMSRSVETTQGLHPEDAASLVNLLLSQMVDALAHYEGRVDGFLGDGFRAVFGSPRAHENDPERAILAALRIREAAGRLRLSVTSGINTGEVYLGRMVTGQDPQTSVMGPVVNLAARLQASAAPGEILVSEATYRQARHAFVFEPLSLSLKGISSPVRAYRVLRPRSRPRKGRGIPGLRTALIGRDRELAALREAQDAARRGQGRVVLVTGEAGVGKTRLVSELRHLTQQPKDPAEPPTPLWLDGRCPELATASAYSVFTDLLARYLSQADRDGGPSAALQQALGDLVAAEALGRSRAEEIRPLLASLLAAPVEPDQTSRLERAPSEQLRHQTFLAFRDLLAALTRLGPVTLVLDDLHWADSLSLDLILLLLQLVPRSPVLMVCICRPERDHRCSQLAPAAEARCPEAFTRLDLRELTPLHSRCLLGSLLRNEALPREAEEAIIRLGHGNPLFLEEVVRDLLERGLLYQEGGVWRARPDSTADSLPDSLRSLVLSRVDRLEPRAKQMLQTASVVGHQFRYRLLESLLGGDDLRPVLEHLQERGLVVEERAVPEEVYSFRHVLTREAVYRSLLKRHRAALHQKVAEALEALQPGAPEVCEELAEHYSLAGNAVRASEYLLAAGRRAARLYANQEAEQLLRRALKALEDLPDDAPRRAREMECREALGEVLFVTGNHQGAEEQFAGALSLAQRLAPERRPHLAARLADAVHWQGRYEDAIAVAEEALALSPEGAGGPETANLLEVVMRSRWAQNDWEAARRYVPALAEILPGLPFFGTLYACYYAVAWVELMHCSFGAAREWLLAMERVCAENGDERGLARCYHGLGDLARAEEKREEAIEWFARSLDLSEQVNDSHLLVEGHFERAHLLIVTGGDRREAERHIAAALGIARAMAREQRVASVPIFCEMLGTAHAMVGEGEAALRYYERIFEFGPPPSAPRLLCKVEALYARQGRAGDFRAFCDRHRGGLPASLLTLALSPAEPSPRLSRLAAEEPFTGGPISEAWTREAPTAGALALDDCLALRASPGQTLTCPDPRVPCLAREVRGDFAVEVELAEGSEQDRAMGGVLLREGRSPIASFHKGAPNLNDLRLDIHRGQSCETVGRGWLPGPWITLRLEREGTALRALCRAEGGWMLCGTAEADLGEALEVCLYAACPAGPPGSRARFRGFRLLGPSGS